MPIFPVRPPPNIASGFKPAGRPNHFGVDLAGTAGDPVGSPEAGTVAEVWGVDTDGTRADNTTVAADGRFDGYGPAGVLIKGDSGVFHLLAHLDPQGWLAPTETSLSLPPTIAVPRERVFVPAKGDKVLEGEQVGRMPTHVGAAGPHVHWEVRKQPIDNPTTRELNTVDPSAWVAAGGDTSKLATVKSIAAGKPGDIPFWVWLLVGYWLIRKA
jgi:murein DD-endopeptidase MepM/ murein hydrolase activator NlpD